MRKKIIAVQSLYLVNNNIYMASKKKNISSTIKRKKPHERKVADDLIKKSERNEKLREKTINPDIFDIF